jgi:glycosyltransferase involved in cell wall biosynthesis
MAMPGPSDKVVHLTSVHQPFDIRIFHKECRSAVEAGYEVVLIAPHESDEEVDGVRIRAVPRSRRRVERMTRTVWRIYRTARSENGQLYHFHDAELMPLGLVLKLTGRRVIYDAHEDLPRSIQRKGWIAPRFRPLLAKGAAAIELVSGHVLDGVVAATPIIAHRFPPRKAVTVHNYPLRREFAATGACPYRDRSPTIAYAGAISVDRGMREMVRAVALLPASLGATLALAGKYAAPGLEAELRGMVGWERVEFLGWQSRAGITRLLGQSRVGLVVLQPAQAYVESQPIKLFEYMAAGIPVVASDFPIWRGIVDEAGCGLLVDPRDPQAIAAALCWLLEHPEEAEAMGNRGRAAAESRFNWDSEAKVLNDFYRKLLGRTLFVDAAGESSPEDMAEGCQRLIDQSGEAT